MAATAISDVIVPEVFTPYMEEQSNKADRLIQSVIVPEVFTPYVEEQSNKADRLIQSGAVVAQPALDALLAGGGTTFNVPSWNPITNPNDDYDVGTDDPTDIATPVAITARKQVGVRLEFNKSWASADLAASLAGSDPMSAAAMQLGQYQASRRQRVLVKQLTGMFGATNMSTSVNNISITTGTLADANYISAGATIDTTSAWGDYAANNVGKILVVHSDVHRRLQKQNLIDFQPTNAQDIGFGTYLGMTLLVDDGTVKDTTVSGYPVYTSYIIGQGGVGFGYSRPKMPVEVQREALQGNGAGVEYLIMRDCFTYHVAGMKWLGGSVAGDIPTLAELATAANWTRVFDQKMVPIAALKTNG